MSMEAPARNESPFSEEELVAARELVTTDEYLKNDEWAHEVVENGGFLKTTNTYAPDLGNWLVIRRDALESGMAGDTKTEARIRNNPDATVVHSEKTERKME